jgi:hypothetical protein
LQGKAWLEQVIQLPASMPLRLEALATLVRGYGAIQRYDAATKLMDQFEAGSQGAEAVALLRRELDETRFQQETAAKAYEARAKASYWAHVEARLDQARAKGDGEAVALYEGLLKNKD